MRRNKLSARKSCSTIAKFEASQFIFWKGLELKTVDPPTEKLSQIKSQYIASIKGEIDKLFPEPTGASLKDLEVFDHRRFTAMTENDLKRKFVRAAKYMGFGNIPSTYVNEYVSLVGNLKRDPVELCNKQQSSPRLAWIVYLGKFSVSGFLRKIILSVIIGNVQL